MLLQQLGWNNQRQSDFEPHDLAGCVPGRVVRQERDAWFVQTEHGDPLLARISGRLRNEAGSSLDLPGVGDWVALRHDDGTAVIQEVLPRTSVFTRQMAGRKSDLQVVATNLDVVFLVTGLDADFNPRRIERYLALAHASGATPVILLNKLDLCTDLPAKLADVQAAAPGIDVHPVSAIEGDGVTAVREYLGLGRSAALLGSSGVGKSTLTNALLGETRQETQGVRSGDSKGRHTTTRRELFLVPDGGVLIDTPGMRELQLTGDAEVGDTFREIESLARQCKFGDCQHEGEPGCAVQAAMDAGTLDPERLASQQKLQREAEFEASRTDPNLQRARRDRWKAIHKQARQKMKRSHKWYE